MNHQNRRPFLTPFGSSDVALDPVFVLFEPFSHNCIHRFISPVRRPGLRADEFGPFSLEDSVIVISSRRREIFPARAARSLTSFEMTKLTSIQPAKPQDPVLHFLYNFSKNPSRVSFSTIELSWNVSGGTPFLPMNSRIVCTASGSARGIRSRYVTESR